MSMLEDLCDALARDVVAAQDEIGDDRFYERVSKVLLDMSPTTQEAYMTSIRVILAERRARKFLDEALARSRAEKA